jgi:hypothetical protein
MEWDTSWAGFTGEYLVGTISPLENLEARSGSCESALAIKRESGTKYSPSSPPFGRMSMLRLSVVGGSFLLVLLS